jgi:hypothetical protein
MGVTVLLTLQTIAVVFHNNQYKYCILRIFGNGFFHTYGDHILQFGVFWMVELSIIFIIGRKHNLRVYFLITLVFAALELLLSYLELRHIENKNRVKVLKGEE